MTARARVGDPETSHEAAARVSGTMTARIRAAILDVLAEKHSAFVAMRGMAALSDELLERLVRLRLPTVTPSSYRSRRAELVKDQLVEHDGYGTTSAGRPCRRWRITTAGLARQARTNGEWN